MKSQENSGDPTGGSGPDRSVLRRLLAASGAVCLALGCAGLLGLYSGITLLAGFGPGYKLISLCGALVWCVFGGILIFCSLRPPAGRVRLLFAALLALIAIVSAINLPMSILGYPSLAEELINSSAAPFMAASLAPVSPGGELLRIAGALGLFLYVILGDRNDPDKKNAIGLTGLFCISLGLMFLLSYLCEIPGTIATPFVPIAFPSAAAAVFTGIGLVAAAGADALPLAYFSGPSTRARLLRAFVPLTLLIVLAQGLITLTLIPLLQINLALGLAASIVVFCLVTSLVVIRVAGDVSGLIDQETRKREAAESELKKNHADLRTAYEHLTAVEEELRANYEELGRSQQALLENKEWLRLAQDAAHAGSWEWVPGTETCAWSENIWQLLGLDLSAGPASFALWMGSVHPNDRENVTTYLRETAAGGHPLSAEWRVKSSRDDRWLMCRGQPVERDGKVSKYIGIIIDITEQKRAEHQRDRFIRDLEEKNAELERFTYTVSHDLRSPLITIRGFAVLLEEDIRNNDTEKIARDFDRITAAAEKMETLLKDLLNLSRIGRMINPPETVPFGRIAGEAVEILESSLRDHGVTVTIGLDLPDVTVDRVRILEVITNLVENAVKFMGDQPHPAIMIGVEYSGRPPMFFVRDNGIGIDANYHERIFNLFEKLDARRDGSGTGLAIVKRIIEVHGGKIWVESAGPGTGSTFFFTLPAPGSQGRHNT